MTPARSGRMLLEIDSLSPRMNFTTVLFATIAFLAVVLFVTWDPMVLVALFVTSACGGWVLGKRVLGEPEVA